MTGGRATPEVASGRATPDALNRRPSRANSMQDLREQQEAMQPSAATLAAIQKAEEAAKLADAAYAHAAQQHQKLVDELKVITGTPVTTPRGSAKPKKGKPKVDPRAEALAVEIEEAEIQKQERKQAQHAARRELKTAKAAAESEQRAAYSKMLSERNVKQAAMYARAYQNAREEVTAHLDKAEYERKRERRARAWAMRRVGLPRDWPVGGGPFAGEESESSEPVRSLKEQLGQQFTRM